MSSRGQSGALLPSPRGRMHGGEGSSRAGKLAAWQLRLSCCSVFLALLFLAMPAAAAVLTGKVVTDDAQAILTPPSMSSPVVLQYYVAEGTKVEKGDVLLRIDAGQAASRLRDLRNKIDQARARADKQLAELKLKQVDAEMALVDAKAARDTAAVDAGIPKELLSALDYDRYQGVHERAQRDVLLKKEQLAAARAAVARSIKDGKLEVEKLELELLFAETQVEESVVTATRSGIVVHAFNSRGMFGGGGRYDQGSTSFPGNEVGQVVGSGGHSVEAWALASDRRDLKVGQEIALRFDALPGVVGGGTIRAISGSPEVRSMWGDGRYYRVEIELDEATNALSLMPGMSVLVAPPGEKLVEGLPPATARSLQITGEVYARKSVAITPPQIQGLWQLNVTRIADDGAKVTKGDPIVTFAGGNLAQELPTRMSQLAAKKRETEKLELELADRKRATMLDTEKARADAEKATRKAEQPAEYVPGVEYRKLIIDRDRARKHLELAERREQVDAAARRATLELSRLDVAQLESEVAEMQQSMAQLTVKAPSAGIFIHETLWSGEKIDVGSSVFRGRSVGAIPDLTTVAVTAALPERQLTRVEVGQPVRVVLTGSASRSLPGHIASIGSSVHSKSRVEPVPVVDLDIEIDADHVDMKPGQPVRVELLAPQTAEVKS